MTEFYFIKSARRLADEVRNSMAAADDLDKQYSGALTMTSDSKALSSALEDLQEKRKKHIAEKQAEHVMHVLDVFDGNVKQRVCRLREIRAEEKKLKAELASLKAAKGKGLSAVMEFVANNGELSSDRKR